MRHVKKISESFIHNWRKKNDLIESIWGLTEGDIFDDFADIEDEFDVEIQCNFFLESPIKSSIGNKAIYNLNDTDEERMEAYGAAGFLPIIEVIIEILQGDVREVQSVMMDCLKNVEGYYLQDVSKNFKNNILSRSVIKLRLAQEKQYGEKEFSPKTGYHEKSNIYFNEYFTEFRKKGYKVIINKIFQSGDRYYMKSPVGSPIYTHGHPMKTAIKKLYSIDLEKDYEPNLEMIDELSEMKKCFESCINKLATSKEFYDVSYDFEIKQPEKLVTGMQSIGTGTLALQIKNIKLIRFSIAAYEL